ncbi:MAG: hypothetical protein QOC80_1495 [Frankiaceae bacterium]|jgi:hypothetical protein|nr:hypothetical protein [Frankiaceae bacterium]
MERPRLSVEQKIRAAQQAGLFDNLPGAGKPLDHVDLNDPDWFVKRLVKREKIDPGTMLHPTIALRREAESFPESLAGLRTEAQVRAFLEDFNERVKAEWRRPQVGPSLAVIARPVDVDKVVGRWAVLREQAAAQARALEEAVAADAAAAASVASRRRWWRRRS